MKRLLIVTVSLSLSLGGVHCGALAQQTAAPVIPGNVKRKFVNQATVQRSPRRRLRTSRPPTAMPQPSGPGTRRRRGR